MSYQQYNPGIEPFYPAQFIQNHDLQTTERDEEEVVENSNKEDDGKPQIIMVHLFNIPPGTKWRQIKNELLVPFGINEDTILHIQVFEDVGSCIVSLNSSESADIMVNDIEGFNWNGYYVMVRTDEQVQRQQLQESDQPAHHPQQTPVPIDMTPLLSRHPSFLPQSASNNQQPLQAQLQPQQQQQQPQPTITGILPPGVIPLSPSNLRSHSIHAIPLPSPPHQYIGPTTHGALPPGPVFRYAPPPVPTNGVPVRYNYLYSNGPVPGPVPQPTPSYYYEQQQHQIQQSSYHQPSDPRYITSPLQHYTLPNPSTSSSPILSYRTPSYPYNYQTRSAHQYHDIPSNRSFYQRGGSGAMDGTTTSSSPSVSSRTLGSLRQYPYQNITDIDTSVPDKTRLFIGNIPYTSEWKDLKDYLRNAGSILRVEIPSDSEGSSKGFAIATYQHESDAQRAIDLFNGVEFEGRPLTVRFDRFPIKRHVIAHQHVIQQQNLSSSSSLMSDAAQLGSTKYQKTSGEETEVADDENNGAQITDLTKVSIIDDSLNPSIIEASKLSADDDKRYEDEARNLIESIKALNFS